MLEQFRSIVVAQYGAALKTLSLCVEQCPDVGWNSPVHELAFCQASFHALFFMDLYLGNSIDEMKQQAFHQLHADIFDDYEELQPRRQEQLYERAWIMLYIEHCRSKMQAVLNAETATTLETDASWGWMTLTRSEMHINNIRHVQHHAAQLVLRLRMDHGVDTPWFKSGWEN